MDDDWQSTFLEMNSRTLKGKRKTKICSDCGTKNGNAGQNVVPKIKSYKEAIVALEDVVLFLKYKGNTKEAMSLGSRYYNHSVYTQKFPCC